MAIANYQLGFWATHQEGEINSLPIQGSVPEWLRGSLIRTGPGNFEVGKQSYHHWFDGLAMLRKFSFEDGQVSFTNRFLESQAYQEAKVKGKISRSEFGTTVSPVPTVWSPSFGNRRRPLGSSFAHRAASRSTTPFDR